MAIPETIGCLYSEKSVTSSKMHFIYEEHPCFPTMNVFYRRVVFEAQGGFGREASRRKHEQYEQRRGLADDSQSCY